MPNREYREQRAFDDFWPSNWNSLHKEQQEELSRKFLNYMVNERKQERVVKEFWPSNWSEKGENQKIKSCQRLENTLAFESGRTPYRLIPLEDCSQEGLTDNEKKTISINLNNENPYEILETVVHESCHADQYNLFIKRDSAQYSEESMKIYKEHLERSGLSERDVLVMNWETWNYMSENKSILQTGSEELYQMQLIEVDADFESVKFLRNYSKYMEPDSDFDEYLEEREDELEDLQGLFKKRETVEQWFEDRLKRHEETKEDMFGQCERDQLKSLYSLRDFGECGFKILSNLENWGNTAEKATVKKVTLDELLGKTQEKSTQGGKRSYEMSPITSKKARIGLG